MMRRTLHAVVLAAGLGPSFATITASAADQPPIPPASELSTDTHVGVQVVATTTAQIGAPMSGQLIEFPVADGEAFEADRVLARFNCAQQEAALARAKAEVVKRQDILTTQQSLKALDAYSKLDFKNAVNDVALAKAELALTQAAIANCVVKAPFAGRVANIAVHNFQFVQAGAPLLDILDDQHLELELVVPSRWLVWLHPGVGVKAKITETQKVYDGTITRLSGRVDAASQTIKVYAQIKGGASDLLPGMSGVGQFPSAPE
jgi:RND family efflux transporter MFP subunit